MYSPTTAPINAKPMFTRSVEKIHGSALGTMSLVKIIDGLALNEWKRFSRSLSTSRAAAQDEIMATAKVEMPASHIFEEASEPNQITMSGPSAIFGILFRITDKPSATPDTAGRNHSSRPRPIPRPLPMARPASVSYSVTHVSETSVPCVSPMTAAS